MLEQLTFHRIFSKTMYKNLSLPLGEMTFTKDFVNAEYGDLYPIILKSSGCTELVEQNCYWIQNGCIERMFTRFFPYATYEISFDCENGSCGFTFHFPSDRFEIVCTEQDVSFWDGFQKIKTPFQNAEDSNTMIVSCRPGAFDVYFLSNDQPQYFHTFQSERCLASNLQTVFESSYVSINASGRVQIKRVRSYIDCGISQADIRAVRYENGEAVFEHGKLYFTASIRMQQGSFQGVFAWIPSTSNIELTGALFFDCGDGVWRNYLASSLLYHRKTKEWYLWVSSCGHKHILCHASFAGEPRFGVNVIDVVMMETLDGGNETAFVGFQGDEDPDFYYNEQEEQWYMAICRLCTESRQYRYLFFKSKDPFSGYKYVGQGDEGAETGGSFVKIKGETAFVCGNDFNKRANYRIYTKAGMQEAAFDFDDGGFRGWGTIIPIAMGSRKRYFWLTFDRHKGSGYNWSYGNLYCFELKR